MTDADLRALERRFRATGNVEDESAWLWARVNAGQLEPRWFELAARLDLGDSDCDAVQPVSEWLTVKGWGPDPVARAVLATVSSILNGLAPSPAQRLLSQAFYAVEEWILAPSPEVALDISAGFSRARWAVLEKIESYQDPLHGLLQIYLLVSEPYGSTNWQGNVQWALRTTEEVMTARVARDVLRIELRPWLLGYSDPVRERVEPRQGEATSE